MSIPSTRPLLYRPSRSHRDNSGAQREPGLVRAHRSPHRYAHIPSNSWLGRAIQGFTRSPLLRCPLCGELPVMNLRRAILISLTLERFWQSGCGSGGGTMQGQGAVAAASDNQHRSVIPTRVYCAGGKS